TPGQPESVVGRRAGCVPGSACAVAGGRRRHGQQPGLAARRARYRAPELPERPRDEPRHVAGAALMVRIDPGGGGGTINVTPQDLAWTAKAFSTAQNDLSNTWDTLQSALDGAAGMAGDDSPAQSFNSKYGPAVQAAWSALRSSALALGGISTGLTQTANNFVLADHHSSAHRNGSAPTFAPEPVFDDIVMPTPDSAIGPGET